MAELDGFDSARIALLNENEEVITGTSGLNSNGVFPVNAKTSRGVLSANVTGLEPQTSNISGSDQIVDVSGAGTGEVQLTLGVNDLPPETTYKLIGYSKAEDGSWFVDPDTKPPFAAVELVSHDYNRKAVYMGLFKGKFSLQDKNLQSNSGNGQPNRVTDSLQFRAINRDKDKRIYKIGFETDSNFKLDTFRSDLFPKATDTGTVTYTPNS